MSTILVFPHAALRTPAQPVTQVDRYLRKHLRTLQQNLTHESIGVGLAATQLGFNQRFFALYLPGAKPEAPPTYRVFINPEVKATSKELTLGSGKQKDLEGCLSVPKIYAPVWRPTWIELEFSEIVGDQLQVKREKFTDFAARVVAHENDHLNGILFVDHVLKQKTPLYLENAQGDLDEITTADLFAIFGKF